MKNSLLRKIMMLIAVSFSFLNLNATHNRAGEITYVQISDLTYEITLTTFTYTLSYADRPTLEIEWGDNTTSIANRESIVLLPNQYQKNTYRIQHTYPGPGIYRIVVQDPNRNAGVKNIPNSVNVVFSISTTLIVNPAMGRNSTPILLNPPYDKAAYGHIFIHNPAAYDPDGDSLAYKLTVCTREDGRPIENYTLPPATNFIKVDSISGDLIWDTPADTGKFNVAMEIQEWRNKKKIGVVVRDMQIEVYDTDNEPPVNSNLRNYCVEVGQPVEFIFSASDVNRDSLALSANSGIFDIAQCKATFTPVSKTEGFASARFSWVPCYEAVRNQPYNVIFKSEDFYPDIRLSDIDNMNIKVLGPPPALLSAEPEGKAIRLNWTNYGTSVISGFSIYRKEGSSTFTPDSCSAGLPVSTGFVKVGYVEGSGTTTFIDTDNGQGLLFGREYAYRIVAVFPNGTESKASNEKLSSLVSGIPAITNVSVTNTDPVNGSIYLAWRVPDLDTIPSATGPFEYVISRALGTTGTNYTQIAVVSGLTDTTYTDSGINTQSTGYIYRIELYNTSPRFIIGEPSYASSLFLTLSPGDRKVQIDLARNVPWINTAYNIYRAALFTGPYDSVGTTNQLRVTDFGLTNGKEYCYYISSSGGYPGVNMPKNLVNLSQRACITPIDNEAPCPPLLSVSSQCDSLYNTLTWVITDPLCSADIAGYRIWYKLTTEETLTQLAELTGKNNYFYRHSPGEIIAGCYAISAFDSIGNEGQRSATICIDSCDFYEIPNVFTPNGDNINDKLVARTSGLVERVEFKLFNRSGMLLFSTADPRIEWDGTYKGRIVSPGIYFYQCDVYERRISGLELTHISGFVHVITEENSELQPEITK